MNNTLKKLSKGIKVIEDQIGSPTWTYRLALQIKEILNSDAKGTFHVTSEGYCSRFEYAKHILKRLKIKSTVKPCRMNEYPAQAAKRPVNCILENRLLKKMGLNIMPDWKEDLDTYLEQYGKDLVKRARAKKSKKG